MAASPASSTEIPARCPVCSTEIPPGRNRCHGCGKVFGEDGGRQVDDAERRVDLMGHAGHQLGQPAAAAGVELHL